MSEDRHTPFERASRIALKVDGLVAKPGNRQEFLSQIEAFKREAADWRQRRTQAEQVLEEAARSIAAEVDAMKAGTVEPRLTDRGQPPGPGWEWQTVDPPAELQGWIPGEALTAHDFLGEAANLALYWPGPNLSLATMFTLVAALHDECLPNSPTILDPASDRPSEVAGGADGGLRDLHAARVWCIGAKKGNTDRLDALETYLNHVRADLEQAPPATSIEQAMPRKRPPLSETERARRIALKVDGLYHTNPGRWHDQWAKAAAEADDWYARDQEARRKKQDALDDVWREVRAVEAGRAEARLTNRAESPGEGWRWEWGRISDPANWNCAQYLHAWMPPDAAIAPERWPRPAPSLAAQYLILAVFHDVVLPEGSAKIMHARTAGCGAPGYVEEWNFDDGAPSPSLKELQPQGDEFRLRLSHSGLDRVMTYLNAVQAEMAKGKDKSGTAKALAEAPTGWQAALGGGASFPALRHAPPGAGPTRKDRPMSLSEEFRANYKEIAQEVHEFVVFPGVKARFLGYRQAYRRPAEGLFHKDKNGEILLSDQYVWIGVVHDMCLPTFAINPGDAGNEITDETTDVLAGIIAPLSLGVLDGVEAEACLRGFLARVKADLAEAESVEAPPARKGKTPTGRRQRRHPPDIALAAYRIEMATGMNQTDIAAKLQAEFTKPVSQGQVSRWIKAVKKFLKDGNVLPSIEPMTYKPKSFDPSVLEMGRRQDGRAVRQRDRRDPDSTEDRD